MKEITIKTEIEQFQEQYPELYQQVYYLGYQNAYNELQNNRHNDDDDDYNCKPLDDSKRYYMYNSWFKIYEKATSLIMNGYTSYFGDGDDWKEFMNLHQDDKSIYLVWNPTHKLFAIETSHWVIDRLHPHLSNADPYYLITSNVDELPF